MHCYMHIIDKCKQDWFSVMYVLEASLLPIRANLPDVKEVFLRSDNAGCYHNAQVILGLPALGQSTGLIFEDMTSRRPRLGRIYMTAR